MKYLKPHIYLEDRPNDSKPKYELVALIKSEDNVKLTQITGPKYHQTIELNGKEVIRTVIDLTFDNWNQDVKPGKQPLELVFDLDRTQFEKDKIVIVRATHRSPTQDHNGSSQAHVEDAD